MHETENASGDGAGGCSSSADSPKKQYHGWFGFVRRMCNEPAPVFHDVQAEAGAMEIPAAYVELATLGSSQFCGEYGCLTGAPGTQTPTPLHVPVSHTATTGILNCGQAGIQWQAVFSCRAGVRGATCTADTPEFEYMRCWSLQYMHDSVCAVARVL